ncbi:hypothetical protein TCAL_15759 [Tigriopus californicus]|uniref:Uncharacterized protein n=1 Tax=Tigriopus californicus TaxID=6832 RepID=A0A553P6G9_TIGCA|nr:hypothetical protein TCAL_15759 [Tigriopus californicus]
MPMQVKEKLGTTSFTNMSTDELCKEADAVMDPAYGFYGRHLRALLPDVRDPHITARMEDFQAARLRAAEQAAQEGGGRAPWQRETGETDSASGLIRRNRRFLQAKRSLPASRTNGDTTTPIAPPAVPRRSRRLQNQGPL